MTLSLAAVSHLDNRFNNYVEHSSYDEANKIAQKVSFKSEKAKANINETILLDLGGDYRQNYAINISNKYTHVKFGSKNSKNVSYPIRYNASTIKIKSNKKYLIRYNGSILEINERPNIYS
jgi:hypothetical protein